VFDKDIKIVILEKNSHHVVAEKGKKSNERLQKKKKYVLRGLVDQNLGKWFRFMLIKVEIHT
jgi:hypothetical protein